jgi:hypothetical protein
MKVDLLFKGGLEWQFNIGGGQVPFDRETLLEGKKIFWREESG